MTGRAPGGAPVRRPPGPAGPAHDDHDRGAVTVEAALALGSLMLVLAVALGAVGGVMTAIRCTDAAREFARLAARGEPERGERIAAALAPPGAQLTLTHDDDTVTAAVSAALLPPLSIRVGGRAVAATEPGVRDATRETETGARP